MKLEPLGTKAKREDILRGVFEDNLRIVNKQSALPKSRARRRLWAARAALLAVAAVVLVGGFEVYQEINLRQRGSTGSPLVAVSGSGQRTEVSAAERMAREFGNPDDPGLDAAELPIANVFNLQVKTIVLDPGHGGVDPGAIGTDGTREKDVTLDVARRLQRRLQRLGFDVLLTRDDDRKVSLRDRVTFANEHAADLFVSIHVNALPVDSVTSIETYYFGLQTDAQTLRVAALENEDSELSMADFRGALDKMGTTMKFQESKQLAASIQRTLYRNMRRVNSAVSDWGVRRGPFVVLLGVEVPSVLAEIAVISNRAEEAKLNTPDHREALAASLEAGIVSYLHPTSETRESTEGATAHGSETDDEEGREPLIHRD